MGFIIILVAILQIVLQHLNLSKIIHKLLFGELDLSLDSCRRSSPDSWGTGKVFLSAVTSNSGRLGALLLARPFSC